MKIYLKIVDTLFNFRITTNNSTSMNPKKTSVFNYIASIIEQELDTIHDNLSGKEDCSKKR